MEITAALAEQLHGLTHDPAGRDTFAAGLNALGRDVLHAVPSCLAVTLSLERFGSNVGLTIMTATKTDLPVLASLAVPLNAQNHEPATLILQAGQAGAFLLLADDLGARLRTTQPPMQIDQHLTRPPPPTGETLATSLADLSMVNQALGVLLAQGLSPEAARTSSGAGPGSRRFLWPTLPANTSTVRPIRPAPMNLGSHPRALKSSPSGPTGSPSTKPS